VDDIDRLRAINAKLATACEAARQRLSAVGLPADRRRQPIADIDTLVRQLDAVLAEACAQQPPHGLASDTA
jgi:hypothetical protein